MPLVLAEFVFHLLNLAAPSGEIDGKILKSKNKLKN